MENKFLEKDRTWLFKLIFPLYVVLSLIYLAWRTWVTFSWDGWYVWPLLASEAFSVVVTILYLATSRRIVVPVFRRAPADRTVDAFIPTYNEPQEIVELTTIGALQVRGVRDVYVLDDSNRPSIRAMAEALGAKYLSRLDNTHAKAGNMNAGIRHSDAEFMLFFDCDHVPQPQFIERTLGYFDDPKLAFVQTPQLFYNTDSIQFRKSADRPLWNEQSMFYESIQPSKNGYNAAFFCGSGALLRRSAIDSVGGFATGTATEDIHTSLRLHAQGWRSLFVTEELAHGIAPTDLTEYHKQRVRWGAGSLGLLLRSKDSPLFARGLTWAQRVCYFNSTFSFTFGLQRIFYLALPALILLSIPFIEPQDSISVFYYLAIMLGFVGLSYLCTWLHSNRTFHPVFTDQYNIANMFSHVMAITGAIAVQKKFNVSIKSKVARQRSPVETGIVLMCLALAFANVFGLVSWNMSGRAWDGLLTNVVGVALFWNTLNLLLVIPFLLFLRAHGARTTPPFAIPVPSAPAVLAQGELRQGVAINRLDLTGAAIATTGAHVKAGDYSLTFDTGEQEVEIPVTVVGREHGPDNGSDIHLAFGDLSPRVAVALTRYLFHRIVPQTLHYGAQRDQGPGSLSMRSASPILFGRPVTSQPAAAGI